MKKRKKKQLKTNTKHANKFDSSISVTICDSANADKAVGKLTKSVPSLKRLSPQPLENPMEHLEDLQEEEEEAHVKQGRRKGKTPIQSNSTFIDEGRVFPFDLWETLANYILPESINVYARLCKDAYQSVNRVAFWINLYQRCVIEPMKKSTKSSLITLPLCLQSDYVNANCRGNLRLHVVKALFFTYEPLRERLCQPSFKRDPHQIVGMIVQSAWTARKSDSNYKFCFKLNRLKHPKKKSEMIPNEIIDDWEHAQHNPLADISQSSEESCLLLQLDCDAFSLLPGALPGLKIFDFNVISSGDGFRYQKVTLTLGPSHQRPEMDFKGRRSILSPNSITLSIGNILAIHLWPWYHPLFSR